MILRLSAMQFPISVDSLLIWPDALKLANTVALSPLLEPPVEDPRHHGPISESMNNIDDRLFIAVSEADNESNGEHLQHSTVRPRSSFAIGK